jgi:hypothetical protein
MAIMSPTRTSHGAALEQSTFQWPTEAEQESWQVLKLRSMARWAHLEWLSVAENLRTCGIMCVTFKELPFLSARFLRHGLSIVPTSALSNSDGLYRATQLHPKPGEPFDLRCVVGKPKDASVLIDAEIHGDDRTIGLMLGYPGCCTEFFSTLWPLGYIDTTWQMALNSTHTSSPNGELTVKGDWRTNVILRWAGIRPVLHLPCSCNCRETIKLQEKWATLACSAGYFEERSFEEGFYRAPLQWRAIHGRTSIVSPFLEMTVNTDISTSEANIIFDWA